MATTVELRRRRFLSRLANTPRLFVRFFRIVRGLPLRDRLHFAAWQTWAALKGF